MFRENSKKQTEKGRKARKGRRKRKKGKVREPEIAY